MSGTETLQEVHSWLDRLERAVADGERALRERSWSSLGEAIIEQRRLSHGLQNVLYAVSLDERRADTVIDKRIQAILRIREEQLGRMEAFHREVGRRLRELYIFRAALKNFEGESRPHALDIAR